MALMNRNPTLTDGLNKIKEHIYIRSDNEDYIRFLCNNDEKFGKRLLYILSNTIMAQNKLEMRIRESKFQDMAALTWDSFGPRNTGKSWFNFLLSVKILEDRGVENPLKTIIFKDSKGSIINSPSRWNDGIKCVAGLMENKHDGYRFALLQDEVDAEWGEGRMKQSKNQNTAVDNLRKLKVLVGFAHVKKEDVKFNLDMRFLMLGFSKKTRKMAAVLYFTRPLGIVVLKVEKDLAEFLIKEYNEDAVSAVWDKAKAGFHQSATDPDSNGPEDSTIDDNNFSYEIDGDRFKLIRDMIKNYWIKENVAEPYSRILTSFFLWSKELKISNSKRKLHPSQLNMKNLPLKQISEDWIDEVGPSSFTQAMYNYKSRYKNYEEKLNSHDLEIIGENYAYEVLKTLKNGTEYLNPIVIAKQYSGSEWIVKNGKPYDVVLLDKNNIDVVAFNHKLYTLKRLPKENSKLDDAFGRSAHPVSIIWLTRTRPLSEKYYIKFNPDLANFMNLEKLLVTDEVLKKMDLGTQWKEIDWKQLTEILQVLLKSK